MKIDATQRSVALSVQEFSRFQRFPGSTGHSASPWRAQVGQEWHRRLAEEPTGGPDTKAENERPVKVSWRHRGWCFYFGGRIDQIRIREGTLYIREVKTVRRALPVAAEDLREEYPTYFIQAAAYQALLRTHAEHQDKEIKAEVQFIDIESGARQLIPLTEDAQADFAQQLDRLVLFLEDRRASLNRLRSFELQPAFAQARSGQPEFSRELSQKSLDAPVLLVEAPTGFGKTGLVLEHALKLMHDGVFDRCIYLTGRSTGQIGVVTQLQKMAGAQLRFLQMRNRQEHRIDHPNHCCRMDQSCAEADAQQWVNAEIEPIRLFESGTFSLEQARDLGRRSGICPYSLSKACLPHAEIWIGDSNYIFSPQSQEVFLGVQGFDPRRTLLIVDEAHHLPERAASSLSHRLSAADLLFATEDFRINGAPRRLLNLANELARWIESLPVSSALTLEQIYKGSDICEELAECMGSASLSFDELAPFASGILWSLPEIARSFSAEPGIFLHWSPSPGVFQASCLDARHWIRSCLQPFASTLLMSATLKPVDIFAERCGLTPQDCATVFGHAPWRENAYRVAIDCRVDTRLRCRSRYYETTARTVAQICRTRPGIPAAVFFSSFLYAENVMAYVEALFPELRIYLQPRGVELAAQTEFIQESLLLGDALFLVFGSSYAEGIDLLGGRVEDIMIVGPALPEANLVQRTRIEHHPAGPGRDAFRDVYIRPAMQRIHQALGRVVRAPEHRARVLLHGKRFAEAAFKEELAPDYRNAQLVRKDEELLGWLEAQKDG